MGNDFRQNLRDELDYFDLTVKELSAKTNIPKGTLDSYLGDRASMPPADAAVKIALALDLSVEYLVTGRETRHEKSVLSYSPNVRLLLQIVEDFDENDKEIILDFARVIKKYADRAKKG
jgi:transcriptional regulator with XRE-family HTH domain